MHGPTVSAANLLPISRESDIGTRTKPFYRLYANNVSCDNVITSNANLNVLSAAAISEERTLDANLRQAGGDDA